MSIDVDRILSLISPEYVNTQELQAHDLARETFRLPSIVASDHQDFKYLTTSYVQHHHRTTGKGSPTDAAAFGEVRRILDREFGKDPYQDGYAAALQLALDGAQGGLRAILNVIADTLKGRALHNYIDHVFYQHINVLSKEDNLALSRAFFERFGPILRRFGVPVDEQTWAFNTRAALEYHRQVLEQIVSLARKL